MQTISGLSALAPRYDALLLDLWGVIHDGSQLYPGVREALLQLRQAHKKIIFLSNAPRRAAKVALGLENLGIEAGLYNYVVSSGEVGYQWLQSPENSLGKRYYYIGPPRDEDVLDGLDDTRSDNLEVCDYMLNVGFGSEEQSSHEWLPVLQAASLRTMPMVCLNPDKEVVKITGERYPCAGVIAQQYQDMGGTVYWFGKPYAAVYLRCLEHLGVIDSSRILAIGDSLSTDIAGAVGMRIDCVLVKGGILKQQSDEAIKALCDQQGITPNYIIQKLNW